ncbi:MAG: tight adherence protein [Nocardioidaceae bacterium]|nr:tight adherence protein [Nocardioidaceae bacterium]
MKFLAAGLISMAALLWRPPGRWIAVERLGPPVRRAFRPVVILAPLAGVTVLGVLFAGVSAARVVLGATVGAVGMFALRQIAAERRRRRARIRRESVTEAVGLMAAELRAGIIPQRVLAGLMPDFDFLAPAAHAAELGGDVAAALRAEAVAPGGELLAELASAWFVAERSGAPLARVLDRLEETARDDHEIEREVQSGVAPARATGRLMAVLPVLGLSLGAGLGGNPLALLTGTVPGALCLAAGSACACGGVAWVNRIAASAEADR